MLTNFVVDWVNYFSRTLLQGKYIKKNNVSLFISFMSYASQWSQ